MLKLIIMITVIIIKFYQSYITRGFTRSHLGSVTN